MRQNDDRQRLVSMVRGESGRSPLFRFRFGEDVPSGSESIDGREVGKLLGSGSPDRLLFLFGCPPEQRDETLRENPCLVRQGGRFVARNPEQAGPRFLID